MKVISVILWCGGGIEICLLILQLMVMSEIVWWTFPLIARVAITTGAFVTKSIECLLLLFLFTIFTCSDIYRKETKLHQTSLQESYISCRNHTLSSTKPRSVFVLFVHQNHGHQRFIRKIRNILWKGKNIWYLLKRLENDSVGLLRHYLKEGYSPTSFHEEFCSLRLTE